MKQFLGKELEFIPEVEKNGYLMGHTGNYLFVKVKGKEDLLHQTIPVRLEQEIENGFIGSLAD